MSDLKPCPFCGKDDKLALHHRKTRHYDEPLAAVKCNRCGIRGRYQRTDERAVITWNTRYRETCENANNDGYSFRFECSKCGYGSITTNCRTRNDELPNFCPNCGRKVAER